MRKRNSALRFNVKGENDADLKFVVIGNPKLIGNIKERMCDFCSCSTRGVEFKKCDKKQEEYDISMKAYEILNLIIMDELR